MFYPQYQMVKKKKRFSKIFLKSGSLRINKKKENKQTNKQLDKVKTQYVENTPTDR